MRIISEEPKNLNDPVAKRKRKALQLYESGSISAMDSKGREFKVKSQTSGWYTVNYSPEVKLGRCTCPDYAYNDIECKHITAARFFRHEMGYAV
jgi:uncharacterized Zn finger protein